MTETPTHIPAYIKRNHKSWDEEEEPALFDLLNMVGKKSARTLQEEEGLERTDNGMKFTTFPDVVPINQKNYYTEYMKMDTQILPLRLLHEAAMQKEAKRLRDADRARALAGTGAEIDEDDEDDEGMDPEKVIVIHLGSQNIRIGLASDALPRTVPMCTAWKMPKTESDIKPPLPKRNKMGDTPEETFGDDWSAHYDKMCEDLKRDMRANKRKVLPNSKELVINYNKRTPPEKVPEHNDSVTINWTDVSSGKPFSGNEALRIAEDSEPCYRLFWPIQHGRLNENDFVSKEQMRMAIDTIIRSTLKTEFGFEKPGAWKDFACVFVIPDLYDKKYVEMMLEMIMKDFSFMKVSFIQESLAASFGAGYTSACIVDIGAQKTSICCVEDGLCIDDSRVNLKYGGYDVTETFIKMMLFDAFPYQDINLMRRYDFLLAEELKQKVCTMNQAEISVQLYNFHLRAPSEYTRKYNYKTYDEVILAPMGFIDPTIFDNEDKLKGRRRLIDRSYNNYDPEDPDDPQSSAQNAILAEIKPSLALPVPKSQTQPMNADGAAISTPMKEKPNPFSMLGRLDSEIQGTPGTSHAGSPAAENTGTPYGNGGSPAPFQFGNGNGYQAPPGVFVNDPSVVSKRALAAERDSVLPIAPLDHAIMTSIIHASKGDDKKLRDLLGGIMVIGGGAKTPGFGSYLEERLKRLRPDLYDKILVGTSPREMDGQVVTWKGASVFAKLKTTNDTWIGGLEWERLGSRVLHHKLAFYY